MLRFMDKIDNLRDAFCEDDELDRIMKRPTNVSHFTASSCRIETANPIDMMMARVMLDKSHKIRDLSQFCMVEPI